MGFSQSNNNNSAMENNGESKNISCKLTNEALQLRKKTVLNKLKSIMIEKRETENGYAFKFPGSDEVLDDLLEFIKTERTCCDFFTFDLTISGEKTGIWLTMSGAKGVKSFIEDEMGF